MDRQYLGMYLAGQYAPLITEAGLAATDTFDGYGPSLDSVMRLLGLDPADVTFNPTVAAGQEADAILLTRYFALDWILQGLAAGVDVRSEGETEKRSQRFAQVEKLLDRVKAQIPPQYAIELGDFAFGRLQLDIFEPWYTPSANPSYTYP
jgi:hypothetical protein